VHADDGDRLVDAGAGVGGQSRDVALDPADEAPDPGDLLLGGGGVGACPLVDAADGGGEAFPGAEQVVEVSGQVGLDLVAVAAAVHVLDDVPGLGALGDDAVGGALGDARAGRDVAQPYARVVGDAQQHPGVVGQEAPVRDANKLP